MSRQGSKSLAYRINKRRLRHHQYGDPVNTLVGVITRYDQWLAWKYLSGQWSWEMYKQHTDCACNGNWHEGTCTCEPPESRLVDSMKIMDVNSPYPVIQNAHYVVCTCGELMHDERCALNNI